MEKIITAQNLKLLHRHWRKTVRWEAFLLQLMFQSVQPENCYLYDPFFFKDERTPKKIHSILKTKSLPLRHSRFSTRLCDLCTTCRPAALHAPAREYFGQCGGLESWVLCDSLPMTGTVDLFR